MAEFSEPLDIMNRALQHCGQSQLASIATVSKNATEVRFAYGKLRRAELRRNVWVFATRRAVMRPVDTTTMRVAPSIYNPGGSYLPGHIVRLGQEQLYSAAKPVGLGITPDSVAFDPWAQYSGPLWATPWDVGTTYFAGEMVYSPEDDTYAVYLSLTSGNDADPTVVPAYDATVLYRLGDTVTLAAVVYQSNSILNVGKTPGVDAEWIAVPGAQIGQRMGQNWLKLDGATLEDILIAYPLGAGPVRSGNTKNVFPLPYGFVREAPQAPRAGSQSFLGAPSGLDYNDWERENDFIVSSQRTPFVYRYVADIADVAAMDAMFCEGLATRIALEIVETLTQSDSKLKNIGAMYKQFMGEARIINAIEQGSDEPAEDDYITCRT